MKKTILTLSLLAATYASTAMAFSPDSTSDVNRFEGASIGVSTGVQHTRNEWSGDALGASSKNKAQVEVDARYNIPVKDRFLVGVGATYDLLNSNGGTENATRLSLRNQVGVYVAPSYVINSKLMAYAKVGYNNANAHYIGDVGRVKRNVDGIKYGVGLSYALSDRFDVRGEFNRVDYNRENDLGVKSKIGVNTGTVGLGYKF